MSKLRIEPAADGGYLLAGEMTYASVPDIERRHDAAWGGQSRVILDLAGVTRADSAGLALLVNWVRAARATGRTIHFRRVPQALLALARVSDLDEVLALEPPGG